METQRDGKTDGCMDVLLKDSQNLGACQNSAELISAPCLVAQQMDLLQPSFSMLFYTSMPPKARLKCASVEPAAWSFLS